MVQHVGVDPVVAPGRVGGGSSMIYSEQQAGAGLSDEWASLSLMFC